MHREVVVLALVLEARVPREQQPDRCRLGARRHRHRQPVLRVSAEGDGVIARVARVALGPLAVVGRVVREEGRVPVEIDALEEALQRGVVDPEDAVVVLHRARLVVVEGLAQLRRPRLRVVHRKRALPAHLRPRVLELQQLLAAGFTHLRMGGPHKRAGSAAETAVEVPAVEGTGRLWKRRPSGDREALRAAHLQHRIRMRPHEANALLLFAF